ncbi:hypothetical protein GALL_341320 [mine drainage metagenome]|uniref:Uncharacterized protein n=1 Tax=mine drainage metagenome TaxID=410659 RepID=A0A1J5QW68_9ZZZZ
MNDNIPAPHELSDRGWEIASAYFEQGLVEGIARGRQQAEDEWRGVMTAGAAVARMVASAGPYDQLADRRGQHDRATAARALLAERGITTAVSA